MGRENNSLSEAQHKNHSDFLERLGLDPSQVPRESLNTSDYPGDVYLSASPGIKSAVRFHKISIKSLDELKRIIGSPIKYEEVYRSETDQKAPAAWRQERNRITPEDFSERDERDILQAMRMYLMNDVERMASFKDVIDQRHFPLKAAVFSGDDLIVCKDHPLTIGPDHYPIICNYKTVTLKPGGQIICRAPVVFNVQKFIKEV